MVYIMSYNLLSLLTLSGPKLVFQTQTPKLRYFLKFEDMIGFSLLNMDKMSPCFWKLELQSWSYFGTLQHFGKDAIHHK